MPLTRKLSTKSVVKQNTNQDVIGTGVTNLIRNSFTGTGSQVNFTLTTAPLSVANTQVFISGVYQNKDTYTVAGNVITFSVAPPSGVAIEVITGTNYSIGVPGDGTVSNIKMANMPANTIKGNNTGSPTLPSDLSIQNVRDMVYINPTVQRFTSGTGTYNTPANVKYIRVKMVGGGSGGRGSSGNSTAGASSPGTNSTFAGGSVTLTANGAGAAATGISGVGTGGGFSIAGTVIDMGSCNGSHGHMGGPYTQSTAIGCAGGNGAPSVFGGGGHGGHPNTNASAGGNGSAGFSFGDGGGGGGQGAVINSYPGSGGGSGGYIDVIITSPISSYSYTVGTGGAGSAGVGTLVGSGAAGSGGIIIIEEYYL